MGKNDHNVSGGGDRPRLVDLPRNEQTRQKAWVPAPVPVRSTRIKGCVE